MVIGRTPEGYISLVNDLSNPARLAASRAYDAGHVASRIINGFHFYWTDGWLEGWAWLRVRDDLFLFERSQVRCYRFDCGMGPGELAQDLAAAAVGEKPPLLHSDEPILCRLSDLQRRLDRVREQRHLIEGRYSVIDRVNFR